MFESVKGEKLKKKKRGDKAKLFRGQQGYLLGETHVEDLRKLNKEWMGERTGEKIPGATRKTEGNL